MSPFPQYRSKVLTSCLRQLNALRDRTQTVMRKAGMWGRWSLEAALYPIFRWEQVSKTLKRQLSQASEKVVKALSISGDKPFKAISASDPIEEVLASLEMGPISTQTEAVTESRTETLAQPKQAVQQTWLQTSLKKLKSLSQTLVPFKKSTPQTNLAIAPSHSQSAKAIEVSLPAIPIRWAKACGSQLRKAAKRLTDGFSSIRTSANSTLTQVGGLTANQKVQGIATLLSNRHLVLVTPEQTILDILTIRQQIILKQKINWALHRHSVRYHLQQARMRLSAGLDQITGFSPTRFLASVAPQLAHRSSKQVLPVPRNKIKVLPEFSRWIIRGLIGAIASLPFVAIPAIAAESAPQPSAIQSIDAQWIDPTHLKTQLSWDEIQGMASKRTQSQRWLAPKSTEGHISRPQRAGTFEESFYTADNRIEIPVQAEFLGYEPHLLEQVLGWLDHFLMIIETAIASLWQWIGIFSIAALTAVQRVKRFILN